MLGAMHKQCAAHLPDAMHERTDELTDAEVHASEEKSNVSNALAPVGQIYIVRWPAEEFTKVSVCRHPRRWKPYLSRGGEVVGVMDMPYHEALRTEWRMHVELAQLGVPRRFRQKAEAIPYLGRNGAGYTECYIDHTGTDVLHHLMAWTARRAASQ